MSLSEEANLPLWRREFRRCWWVESVGDTIPFYGLFS